ncbi:sulfatase family protein [Allocoleopsis franciscana]|uniref:Arylsulfatase A family protein n=1 Tax=Allocoleopsis franciscana PCC 7113 TaxID=1173027 RepID=K9WP13_9CYAN|nr:sulfatase [Allocoleopsis franciscana]AFZ21282.1 arylsulfatase A family protein [Allocoleopsis franciscana PCC 7113]
MNRPNINIVWICADDFTPDVCGAYGNQQVHTPNLDRLASQGIRFDRAYCSCPLSTPSRQAFFTGRYPRSIGVTLSRTPLPKNEVTLPVLLKRVGYQTAAFGKTHYYFPRKYEYDTCVDLSEYQAWIQQKGRQPIPPEIDVLGHWRPFLDPAAVWLNSACKPYGAVDADMAGTFYASEAARFLQSTAQQPFFLYVSFYETHSPFWFPVEFRNRHTASEFTVPELTAEDFEQIPAVFRNLTRPEKRGIQAAYYTCTEFMDKNVGLVLEALDQSGHADNTLVIFTSDHGYLLGQHGRFEKHCCFEGAVRVALLMRFPGVIVSGQASNALVELIDIIPTIFSLCDVPIPDNLHGRSFERVLQDATQVHREQVIVEYADNAEAMIRTERWKLIYSTGRRRRKDGYALNSFTTERSLQLYDLVNDPDETENLAAKTEHSDLVNALIDRLADHMRRTERDAQSVPSSHDSHTILEYCLPPKDADF